MLVVCWHLTDAGMRLLCGLPPRQVLLYGAAPATCTQRVLAAAFETGANVELRPVNLMAGEHKQPAHIARNPFGVIPAIEHEGLTLYESRACSQRTWQQQQQQQRGNAVGAASGLRGQSLTCMRASAGCCVCSLLQLAT